MNTNKQSNTKAPPPKRTKFDLLCYLTEELGGAHQREAYKRKHPPHLRPPNLNEPISEAQYQDGVAAIKRELYGDLKALPQPR